MNIGKHIYCKTNNGSFLEVLENHNYVTVWMWDAKSESHRQVRLTLENAKLFRKEMKKAIKKAELKGDK